MGREGKIVVLTGGMMGGEKKRFAVLDGTTLTIYKDEKKKGEESVFDLSEAKVQKAEKKKKAVIEIVVGGKATTLVPEASEYETWFDEFSKVAGQAGKKLSVDDFDLLSLIGKGSFGKVMQVKKKDTGEIFAMKVLSKKHIVANNEIEHTKSERNILERLNHPFLIELHYSFQTDDKLYFIMEFVNGGELFHHLQKDKRFSEERVKFYSAEILLALEYLHSQGVVYRDLKPENILVTDKGHIILTDFGLCKEGMTDEEDRTTTFCGTPEYLAPEVLKGQGYNRTVDWWSYGSLVYEMLSGLPPFYSQDVQEMYRKIMTEPLKFTDVIKDDARELLADLLKRDLNERLVDPAKMKEYAFFKGIVWDDIFNKKVPPPYVPKVGGKDDTGQIDEVFLSEKPSLDLGDDEDEAPAGAQTHFQGFTFEADAPIAG